LSRLNTRKEWDIALGGMTGVTLSANSLLKSEHSRNVGSNRKQQNFFSYSFLIPIIEPIFGQFKKVAVCCPKSHHPVLSIFIGNPCRK
jgi:hypothetical protein